MSSKMIPCKDCEAEISKNASLCPYCGAPVKKKRGLVKTVVFALGLFIFFVFFIIVAMLADEPTKKLVTHTRKVVGKVDTKKVRRLAAKKALPKDENAFIKAVSSFVSPYSGARNELKKSAMRVERAKKIKTALEGQTSFNNWKGTLLKAGTNSDGKAYISIRIDDKVTLKTWNNGFSDIGLNTMISQSSKLYAKLADMNTGDRITFSGHFFSDKKDYIDEASVSEAGSMTDPEFIVKISDLSR